MLNVDYVDEKLSNLHQITIHILGPKWSCLIYCKRINRINDFLATMHGD